MESNKCCFISDLHGHADRYEKLFAYISENKSNAVFWGGDLLPSPYLSRNKPDHEISFVQDYLAPNLRRLKSELKIKYPDMFLILGNDDPVNAEPELAALESEGLLNYIHQKKKAVLDFEVYGYAFIPPTPFHWKDWEKYDVSRYVDPGCVSPEHGSRMREIKPSEIRYGSIREDLEKLAGQVIFEKSIFLFHCPPYKTVLDRAALDGRFIDHVPLDVHIGSIAIQRFIEEFQPRITLHGHVHESTRLTGQWQTRIGKTYCFNAAHDGPELSIIEFDPDFPEQAARYLI